MNENQPLDAFLRRLITAPRAKQAEAVQSALALLNGKPPEKMLYTTADCCRLLSISKPSFWRLTKTRAILPVKIPGFGRPRYRHADLLALAGGSKI